MRRTFTSLLFILLFSSAQAGEWRQLEQGEIKPALDEKTLLYDAARQVFYADGKTLYQADRPSWGEWRETNGQYCSIWPPGTRWSCYDLEISSNKNTVRFIDAYGNVTQGSFEQR